MPKITYEKVTRNKDSSFSVIDYYNPYFAAPLHIHPEYELILIEEGVHLGACEVAQNVGTVQGRNGDQVEDGKPKVDENKRLEHVVKNEIGVDPAACVVIHHGSLHHLETAEYPVDDHAEDGHQQIGQRPGKGCDCHASPHADLPVKPIRVDRYGLRPAKAGKQQTDGANRVEMRQRIQGHASLDAGGVVPQLIRRIGVGTFVDGGDHADDDQSCEKIQKGGKIQIQDCVLSFSL